MRFVVVGGAGAMGSVAARELARTEGVEAVTVADLDLEGAQRATERARTDVLPGSGTEISAIRADVSSEDFVSLLRGHDVAIASVAYRLNPLIVEACLAAGTGYVDLGGLFHVARETLDYGDRFAEAGLTGVTCMGGTPGITNLLAVVAARTMGSVHAVHVRVASRDPSVEHLPLPIPYSLETILDEFTVPAMAYREERFEEVPPLGEPEDVDFPSPIGSRRTYTTLHSEVATLPRAFPQVGEVTFKIGFEPAFVERFKLLADMGLASSEPVSVGDQVVSPRHLLAALGRRLPQSEGAEEVECLRVIVEGERDGQTARAVAECQVEPDPLWRVGAGQRDTGIPPAIVAVMIASGEVPGRGMFAPEDAVDPDLFFERLAERGISYSLR